MKKVPPDLILFLFNNLFHWQIALQFSVKNLIVWDSVHAMRAGFRESYFSLYDYFESIAKNAYRNAFLEVLQRTVMLTFGFQKTRKKSRPTKKKEGKIL